MNKILVILIMSIITIFTYAKSNSFEGEIENNSPEKEILSKNFDRGEVIAYLEIIEKERTNGTSLADILIQYKDKRDNNTNLDVALLIYQEHVDSNSTLDIITDEPNNSILCLSETEARPSSIKYKRNWCVAGVASWTPCDENCVPLGGTVLAFCNSYVEECF